MSPPSLSDLPEDVLQVLCEKLIDFDDYVRFGAVCSLFRTILSRSHHNIPSPQCPLLSSVADRPNTHGSSHGWLITSDFNPLDIVNLPYKLVNPFLSVNKAIQLPTPGLDCIMWKFALSDNPTWTTKYVIMAITLYNTGSCRLAFLRPGDTSWTHIHQDQYWFSDLIYYKHKFYAVSHLGQVVCCDVSSIQPKLTEVAGSSGTVPMNDDRSFITYLVESSGELLLVKREVVFREVVDDKNIYSTTGFKVSKVANNKWIEVKTLAGHALFLGHSSSISILASDHPRCRPDRIYFTQGIQSIQDIGVFNVKCAEFEQLQILQTTLIWVQPTLDNATHVETVSPSHWIQSD